MPICFSFTVSAQQVLFLSSLHSSFLQMTVVMVINGFIRIDSGYVISEERKIVVTVIFISFNFNFLFSFSDLWNVIKAMACSFKFGRMTLNKIFI